jgi:hypothetical protein
MTVIVLMFVGNSVFNNEVFTKRFASLGYPTYLIYPLVVAKVLGLVAIWSNKSKTPLPLRVFLPYYMTKVLTSLEWQVIT